MMKNVSESPEKIMQWNAERLAEIQSSFAILDEVLFS
jgi:hypothetical protein